MKRRNAGGLTSGILVLAALGLLTLAVAVRSSGGGSFTTLTTTSFSAQNLTKDAPDVSAFLFARARDLLWRWAKEHLLPAYALLLPALCLAAWGFSRVRRADEAVSSFLEKRRDLPALLFALSFAAVLAAHFFVIGHPPPVGDEFCYTFQADLLSSGRLTAESPPVRDAFHAWSVIDDGKRYCKVTIGWPLILAAGQLLGIEFLAGPLCAALTILVLYLLGEKVLGRAGGLLAAFFALFSPLFLLLGGTYFPQNATGLFALILAYSILKTPDDTRWTYPILGGTSSALLLLIRPGDGAIVFLGNLPLMVHSVLSSRQKKAASLRMLSVVSMFALGVGLLLLVNRAQNGDPLLFGYPKYDPEDTYGFGVAGHTPVKGLWNTAFSLVRNSFWTVPFAGGLALLSLLGRNAVTALLLLPVLLMMIAYTGFYSLGAFEIGSRYYLPAFLLTLVPAAGGFSWLKARLAAMRFPGAPSLRASWMLFVAVFVIAGVYPRPFSEVSRQYGRRAALANWLSSAPGIEGRALIFLRDHADMANIFLTRNGWRTEDEEKLFVLYLTPRENGRLVEEFPDRKVYTVLYDRREGKFGMVPGVDLGETARNYAAAGFNYLEFDKEKAVGAFLRALELGPGDPEVLKVLALLYDARKEYAKEIEVWRILARVPVYRENALYRLGRKLGETGKRDEAIATLRAVIETTAREDLAGEAQGWIDFFSSSRQEPTDR